MAAREAARKAAKLREEADAAAAGAQAGAEGDGHGDWQVRLMLGCLSAFSAQTVRIGCVCDVVVSDAAPCHAIAALTCNSPAARKMCLLAAFSVSLL